MPRRGGGGAGEATTGVPARVPPAVHRHVAEQPLDVPGVPVQRLPAIYGPARTDACWCRGRGHGVLNSLLWHSKLYMLHILPDAKTDCICMFLNDVMGNAKLTGTLHPQRIAGKQLQPKGAFVSTLF